MLDKTIMEAGRQIDEHVPRSRPRVIRRHSRSLFACQRLKRQQERVSENMSAQADIALVSGRRQTLRDEMTRGAGQPDRREIKGSANQRKRTA